MVGMSFAVLAMDASARSHGRYVAGKNAGVLLEWDAPYFQCLLIRHPYTHTDL